MSNDRHRLLAMKIKKIDIGRALIINICFHFNATDIGLQQNLQNTPELKKVSLYPTLL